MYKKLTQYLIDKGYVTEEQCEEAVQRQVVFGGRIGTNLIELYYISEEHLLEGISHAHGVPMADLKNITIPKEVIESFPQQLALKYKVIPIDESRSQYHLAMIEPNNLKIIDEISFVTGKAVKPYGASELSIIHSLEKYYGAEQGRTLVTLPETLDKRQQAWKEKQKRGVDREIPIESSILISEDNSAQAAEDKENLTAVNDSRLLDSASIDDCSQALADAHDREMIASVLIAFAHTLMDHVILFNIKGKEVHGWRAYGRWDKPQNANLLKFSIHEGSILHHVMKSHETYCGPLLDVPVHRKIFDTLGGAFPEEAVAIPIRVREQTICVLVGVNSHGKLPLKDLQDLQKLTRKAAMTFEMLILREKILL